MERKILFFSLIFSVILHAALAYILFSLENKKEEKKENKPIVVSLVKVDKAQKEKNYSAKRKIPKKRKLNTPSKTILPKKKPVSQKSNAKKQIKPKKEKKKVIKKEILKSKKQKKTKNKPAFKNVEKQEVKKREENIQQQPTTKKEIEKPPIKTKEERKIPQIAQTQKNEKREEKKPDVNVPLSKKVNSEKQENNPPKQLNLTHLQGKDQIFQMQSENKPQKVEVIEEAKGDIKKYLYYVRDRLQENLAYPLMAKRLEIEGTVIVRFVIEEDGSVNEDSIKIVKSSGSKILDKQAIITVKNSIPFKPPPEGRIVIEIPVVFEIIRSYY